MRKGYTSKTLLFIALGGVALTAVASANSSRSKGTEADVAKGTGALSLYHLMPEGEFEHMRELRRADASRLQGHIHEADLVLKGNGNRIREQLAQRGGPMETLARVSMSDVLGVLAGENGGLPNHSSFRSKISGNGNFVVFTSLASNLTADDNLGLPQVYRTELSSGNNVLVSMSTTAGVGGNLGGGAIPFNSNRHNNKDIFYNGISNDGTKISFTSLSSDLVAGDTNDVLDVFIWNAGVVTRVGDGVANTQLGGISRTITTPAATFSYGGTFNGIISGDGNSVVFLSTSDDFTSIAGYGPRTVIKTNSEATIATNRADRLDGYSMTMDVFHKNLTTGATSLVSNHSSDGDSEPNSDSWGATISDDGSRIAYESRATNITPLTFGAQLANGSPTTTVFGSGKVYVAQWNGSRWVNARVSADRDLSALPAGTRVGGFNPSISANGNFVAWVGQNQGFAGLTKASHGYVSAIASGPIISGTRAFTMRNDGTEHSNAAGIGISAFGALGIVPVVSNDGQTVVFTCLSDLSTVDDAIGDSMMWTSYQSDVFMKTFSAVSPATTGTVTRLTNRSDGTVAFSSMNGNIGGAAALYGRPDAISITPTASKVTFTSKDRFHISDPALGGAGDTALVPNVFVYDVTPSTGAITAKDIASRGSEDGSLISLADSAVTGNLTLGYFDLYQVYQNIRPMVMSRNGRFAAVLGNSMQLGFGPVHSGFTEQTFYRLDLGLGSLEIASGAMGNLAVPANAFRVPYVVGSGFVRVPSNGTAGGNFETFITDNTVDQYVNCTLGKEILHTNAAAIADDGTFAFSTSADIDFTIFEDGAYVNLAPPDWIAVQVAMVAPGSSGATTFVTGSDGQFLRQPGAPSNDNTGLFDALGVFYAGMAINGPSSNPSRFVGFTTNAPNVNSKSVTTPATGIGSAYIHDREDANNATKNRMVSVRSDGANGPVNVADSFLIGISADGTRGVFASEADDVIDGQSTSSFQIMMFNDAARGAALDGSADVTVLSTSASGARFGDAAEIVSWNADAVINSNATALAFATQADYDFGSGNVVGAKVLTKSISGTAVLGNDTGVLTHVSLDAMGNPMPSDFSEDTFGVAIRPDGGGVAFSTLSEDMDYVGAATDTNLTYDVLTRNSLTAGEWTIASSDPSTGDQDSFGYAGYPVMFLDSATGSYGTAYLATHGGDALVGGSTIHSSIMYLGAIVPPPASANQWDLYE